MAYLCIFQGQPVALVSLVVFEELYLCSSCDHVWDEISVSWSIHQGHYFRAGLKLGHAYVHRHTPVSHTDGSGFRKNQFATCAKESKD